MRTEKLGSKNGSSPTKTLGISCSIHKYWETETKEWYRHQLLKKSQVNNLDLVVKVAKVKHGL